MRTIPNNIDNLTILHKFILYLKQLILDECLYNFLLILHIFFKPC
jgi:hypothetical protein